MQRYVFGVLDVLPSSLCSLLTARSVYSNHVYLAPILGKLIGGPITRPPYFGSDQRLHKFSYATTSYGLIACGSFQCGELDFSLSEAQAPGTSFAHSMISHILSFPS